MGIIHGESCDCCKDLSPVVRQTLVEVQTLMDGIVGLKGSALSDKQRAIKDLQDINKKLAPAGGISDIVALAKKFFAVDTTRINLADAAPDPKKPNKKVGKFKVSDITDNPTIDPTKIMSFQGLNLSKFSSLKISFTVPTLIIVKELKFGPVGIGIKFFISLKEISWAPTLSVDFPTPEAAIAELKKSKVKQIVRPSQGKSIKDLKKLAKSQFSKQPAVLSALEAASTPEDFFNVAKAQGVNLYESVNLGEEAEKIYKEKKNSEKLIKKRITDEVGSKTVVSADDLKEVDKCAPRQPGITPFTEDEILKVIPCAVEKERSKPLQAKVSQELKEITDLLKKVPGPDASEKAKNDVVEFVSKVDAANKIMQDCSKKKLEAVNRWYFFKEAELLHKLTHAYVTKRFSSVSPNNPPYVAIFKERDRLLNERAQLAAKITATENEIQSLIGTYQSGTSDGSTSLAAFTTINPNQLPTDVTTISGGYYTQSSISNSVARAKQTELIAYISQYNDLTNKVLAEAEKYNQQITSFQAGTIAQINSIPSTAPTFGLGNNTFEDKLANLRRQLFTDANPVSNLQGFDLIGKAVIRVNANILEEARIIEANAKSQYISLVTPPTPIGNQVLSGVNTYVFSSYFENLEYDFNPDSVAADRTGVLEEGLWKKYYSPNRIDNLFTWQEQGYTAPKPVYDNNGKALGAVEKVEIVNGQGAKIVQEVPTSVKNCQVNLEVAVPFLDKILENTKAKVVSFADNIMSGSVAQAYTQKIETLATLEAQLYYSQYLSNVSFNANIEVFDLTVPQQFERDYVISSRIYEGLQKKLRDLDSEIAAHDACIKSQQKAIEDAAKEYGKKQGLGESGGDSSANIKESCKAKLGSDPVGATPISGECPNYTKNCYWEEYTKLMQIVSLMPIPDTEQLMKRLFRYYPVALQIPVPAPPGVLPTLALGIPDPQISIPLPFLWKHIISLQTPIGLFVVWIGLAGGIIPNPYIMLVDEKMQASFIVTPKGTPTPIPAKMLNVTDIEKKSLLEMIPGLDGTLRIDMSSPLGKLLQGSTRLDANNPDSPATVIDKLKKKIKQSLDDLEIPDPSFAGQSDRAKEAKAKIKKIFDIAGEIPDRAIIDESLDELLSVAKDAVDKIKVGSIKIPKNAKNLMMEPPAAINMLETFSDLVDSALNGPTELAGKVLGDIGAGIKLLNVKEKINGLVRQEIDKPSIKQAFLSIDAEIDALEASLPSLPPEDIEAARQAIIERTKVVKKAIIKPVKAVAEKITPEMLGFVAIAGTAIPLPFPCYTSVSLPTLPPYITLAIALIQQAPSLLEAFPDEVIADAVTPFMDLSRPLPNAEQIFQNGINAVLALLPDLVLPAGMDENLLKTIKKSIQDFLLTFKIRLPKPGLPTQLVIPGSVIKALIKEAIGIFLNVLKGVLLGYINQIIAAVGPEKVAKILAFVTVMKLMFGVSLENITGKDIKAFITQVIETVAYPPLDTVKTIIQTATALAAPFKSMIELFTLPDPTQIPPLKKEGPFLEIGTKQIQAIVDPLLLSVVPIISQALPFPVILLAASVTPARAVLTKIHPVKTAEKLPSWEGLTLKNIPFTLWLDQLVATAQRGALLGSDYVVPYFTPLTP
jgi:hypothetical protein